MSDLPLSIFFFEGFISVACRLGAQFTSKAERSMYQVVKVDVRSGYQYTSTIESRFALILFTPDNSILVKVREGTEEAIHSRVAERYNFPDVFLPFIDSSYKVTVHGSA